MRVFVALMLPDSARAALQSQLEPARSLSPGLRWERPERWHLTLTFLGEVTPEVVADLQPRLRRAASRTAALALGFDGLGRFGSRVLYATVVGDLSGVRRLADRASAAARRAGAELGDGRYRPHVTVARSRQGVDLRPLVAAGAGVQVEQWGSNQVCLVHSILGSEPRYEVLGRYALGTDV